MKTYFKSFSSHSFRAVVVSSIVIIGGCATDSANSDELDKPDPTPTIVTMTQPEEDVVVPLYKEPDSDQLSQPVNSRSKIIKSAAPQKVPTDAVKSGEGAVSDASTKDPSTEMQAAEIPSADSAALDAPRRTSMPSRDQKGKKPPRVGGVRKTIPVDHAASALFGKWKIDQTNSTVGLLHADSVLFLADGRMRVWRNDSVEDGRWTWNKDDGVKTGGLDGVPFSLGTFEIADNVLTLSMDGEKHVVLIPDKIFVAPPPVLPTPKAP